MEYGSGFPSITASKFSPIISLFERSRGMDGIEVGCGHGFRRLNRLDIDSGRDSIPTVMWKEMNGPHLPNRADIEVPLLRLLVDLGGSVNFSRSGRELEIRLAEKFDLSDEERDFAAPNYNSMGNRKWRNHLQFVRDRLVKSGELDNSVRNHWTVTDAGYRRLGIMKKA